MKLFQPRMVTTQEAVFKNFSECVFDLKQTENLLWNSSALPYLAV